MRNTLVPIAIILLLFYAFYPLGQLYAFDQPVVELPMTSYYLVRVPTESSEIAVFTDYMEKQGYQRIEQMGGLYRFQRDQEVLEITNNQLKTMP